MAAGDIPGREVPPPASLPGCSNPKQDFSVFQQLFFFFFLQHKDLWCSGRVMDPIPELSQALRMELIQQQDLVLWLQDLGNPSIKS